MFGAQARCCVPSCSCVRWRLCARARERVCVPTKPLSCPLRAHLLQSLALCHTTIAEDDTVLFSPW
jgi:hypothetical protein